MTLEVLAVHDELDAQCAHRRVLVFAVAVRHHDHGAESKPARRESDGLPVIAARRTDHARYRRSAARERLEVHQSATHLERARRREVLVLGPDVCADGVTELWPPDARRGQHRLVDHGGRLVEDAQRGQCAVHLSRCRIRRSIDSPTCARSR